MTYLYSCGKYFLWDTNYRLNNICIIVPVCIKAVSNDTTMFILNIRSYQFTWCK